MSESAFVDLRTELAEYIRGAIDSAITSASEIARASGGDILPHNIVALSQGSLSREKVFRLETTLEGMGLWLKDGRGSREVAGQ
jgi:hypothetical protein